MFSGFGGGKGSDSYKMRLAFALMNSRPSGNPYDYSSALNQLSGALLGYAANRDAEKREDAKGKTYAEALKAMGPTEGAPTGGFGPSMDGTPDGPVAPSKGSPMAAARIFAANPDTATQGFNLAMQDMQQQRRQQQEEDRWNRQTQREDQRWNMEDARYGQRTADERAWREKMDAQNFAQQQQMARLQAGLTAQRAPSYDTLGRDQLEALGLPPGTVAQRNAQTGQIQIINKPAANGQVLGYTAEGEPITAPGVKPMTEGQANAALYADRMRNSEGTIKQYGAEGTSVKDRMLGSIPLVGNMLVSDDYQKLDQAQRDFINAVLRRESGAVISSQEFDNARKQYFPMPGDTPEVMAQKEQNRSIALNGISRAAGPAYAVQQPGQGATPSRLPQSAQASIPQAGAVMNGYRFKGGNPADQNSWEQVR